ncbi:MAG: diphthamide synthesis protein [archaeon]
MKVMFIEAKYNKDIREVLKKAKIKGKVGILTTAQHIHQIKEAQKTIKNSVIGGQILGCNFKNAEKIKNKVDAFLFIGSGDFHPLELALRTGKEVYVANPYNNQITKISKEEVEKKKKEIKGKYLKFLNAKKVGILVSTKPGQNNIKKAIELRKKIKKETYIFIFNTLRENELENFPDIDIFINTACPRIEFKKVINIEDLKI